MLHINLLQLVVDHLQDFATIISSLDRPTLDLVPAIESASRISYHVEAALALTLLTRASSEVLEDIRFSELWFHSVLEFQVADSFINTHEGVFLQFRI